MKHLLILSISVLLLLNTSNVLADGCKKGIRSGRTLFSCFIGEDRTIVLYKEFLGSGKRRYKLVANTLPSSELCNATAGKERIGGINDNKIAYNLRKANFLFIRSGRSQSFSLRSNSTTLPLLADLADSEGKLRLNNLNCRQQNREEN